MATQDKHEQFLTLGYKAAIVLAFLSLVLSALYLFHFSTTSPLAVSGQALSTVISPENMVAFSAERRMMLLSTAIFVAMSMLFIGFGLFLIQARGSIDATVEHGNVKASFSRLSPGLLVILCATAIVIICATHDVSYSQKMSGGGQTEVHQGVDAMQDLLDTNSVAH